ncbi:glycosyltransferase [Marivirga salinae]|uniref:Glycosyltransferase n=1 Tax=Marivirga salinarum TaxID=3059078 RepID=A0AA51NB68_9BACT|nr:glycosyltransferase [Marivirga sp. BDSF4-3]WMN12186.1 glycosyltransferase [Marivirga sp. BDSF4-3]
MNSIKKPLLSVSLITYNQENYIAEALQSIINQKGNFELEIVIGNDASTDGTKEIIEKYRKIHPQVIKPIHHKENIGMMNNFIDTYRRCSGVYIAYLEGDDYWTDPLKLDKQISILIDNPLLSFCFTDVIKVDRNGRDLVKFSDYRGLDKSQIIPLKEIIEAKIRKIHIGTILSKRYSFDFPQWYRNVLAGDFIFTIMLGDKGSVYYLNHVTCAYRKHEKSVTNRPFSYNYYKHLKEIYLKSDSFFENKYTHNFDKAINILKAQYNLNKFQQEKVFIIKLWRFFLLLFELPLLYISFRDLFWLLRKTKGTE